MIMKSCIALLSLFNMFLYDATISSGSGTLIKKDTLPPIVAFASHIVRVKEDEPKFGEDQCNDVLKDGTMEAFDFKEESTFRKSLRKAIVT
jgi:hypothetical protein